MPVSPVVLVHMVCALAALLVGGLMLLLRKGTFAHRMAGRGWVLLMAVAALVSFGIRSNGHFSAIHLLSVVALVVLVLAIRSVIKGNITRHRRQMQGLYIGLAVAGLFTLLPGRLLGNIVWGGLGLV